MTASFSTLIMDGLEVRKEHLDFLFHGIFTLSKKHIGRTKRYTILIMMMVRLI